MRKEDIAKIVLVNLEKFIKTEQKNILKPPLIKFITDIALNPLNWGKKRRVSLAAQKLADKMNFIKDLKYVTQNQLKHLIDKNRNDGKGKTALVLDHYVPVKQLISELLNYQNPKIKDILKVMNKAAVNVITWKEHKNLEKLGYKSNRPSPTKAYKSAKIELIH